ncbi:MAG: hypothetical protein JNM43_28260 [Planctomycetaceae bacterium]|nr:hypothetical protein [Planctomycetaceae bacterium]
MSYRRTVFLAALAHILLAKSEVLSDESVRHTAIQNAFSVALLSADQSVRSERNTTNEITEEFLANGRGLMGQIAELIEQRVGWLRPTSTKEVALAWLALSFALPWGFVACLRSLLAKDIRLIRLVVVSTWIGISLWLGWKTWGMTVGAHQFASTMLFGVPLLFTYFASIAGAFAIPARSNSP